MITSENFQGLCRHHFQFLIDDFGCAFHLAKDSEYIAAQFRGYDLRYNNKTTEVSIALDFEQVVPQIFLRRISEIPGVRNRHQFGCLLLVRNPELNPLKNLRKLENEDKVKNGKWSLKTAIQLLNKSVEQLIVEYSFLLKLYANDILLGDFTIFPVLDAEIDRIGEMRGRGDESFDYA